MWGLKWWQLGGFALLAVGGASLGPTIVPALIVGCTGPRQLGLLTQLARKWGPVFGAPVNTILAISKIESSWRPTCANVNARAMKLGGAWGFMAMTHSTAKSIAAVLRKSTNPLVKQTLAKWDGSGRGLLNPDVNVMLGAYYLGKLTREFKDFKLVAAAYHQGPGRVRKMLAEQKQIPAELPPFGKIYVTRALTAHKEVAA